MYKNKFGRRAVGESADARIYVFSFSFFMPKISLSNPLRAFGLLTKTICIKQSPLSCHGNAQNNESRREHRYKNRLGAAKSNYKPNAECGEYNAPVAASSVSATSHKKHHHSF